MDDLVQRTRAHIAEIGALLFDRRLTDAAGGNISARAGDVLCLSPRYSGSRHHWNLRPDDVLVVDPDGNILQGAGEISRESKVHLKLHREFGQFGSAVIHAHARNILVFAALAQSMPAVLEATLKFGEVPVVAYAPSHTPQLAENVAAAVRGQEARIQTHAAGVIAPWHGLFVMGKDLNAAFDAVERMDTNAYCIIMGRMLAGADALDSRRAALYEAAAAFKNG